MSFLFSKKTRVPSIDIDHEMDQENHKNSKQQKLQSTTTTTLSRVRSKSSVDKLDSSNNNNNNSNNESSQQGTSSSWNVLGRARANSSKQNADRFQKAEEDLEREHSGAMTHLKEKGKIGDYEDEHEEEQQEKVSKRRFSLKKKKNAELLTEQ
ncbi:predicted protein [Naegleria gruberi]|uniref:Predicted protein n=1 Tax=Naegleria gruberi TaxID=5762 RepID=D2VCP4_NAEGR|nr:uncharacterized protein NAEGRDRAFT_48473 [Naegleria gruberi]EFC45341.1 predicted protein [Naegleria gruberi]|eukprot:XP_002678085.1 predicted protein [Naegleria gruberi strain NEG-M]